MRLPFTHDQFLDVFAAYNGALWPAEAILWIVTAWALADWMRRGAARTPVVAAVLAVHWAWSGAAYHLAFFRQINAAAAGFGLVFLVEAAVLAWFGTARRQLRWEIDRSWRSAAGVALIAYGMLYPAIGLALGLRYPRMPVFAVPCPTTLVTAGVLLLGIPGSSRLANLIPLAWCAIGGSAASLLGIRADLALPAAGVLLLLHTLAPSRRGAPAARSDERCDQTVAGSLPSRRQG